MRRSPLPPTSSLSCSRPLLPPIRRPAHPSRCSHRRKRRPTSDSCYDSPRGTQDGERMDDQLRELVALGKEHFHRGDYSLAAGHLEQAVARGVAFADVHHMLGVIYHQLGEFEAAQRALQKALEINPGYIEAGLNLAIVCNDMGQYERAQQVYGDAVARSKSRQTRDPNGDMPLDSFTKGKIANLHAAVADGYVSVRRPNDAASEYRRAL